jgi:hypothetical protein
LVSPIDNNNNNNNRVEATNPSMVVIFPVKYWLID